MKTLFSLCVILLSAGLAQAQTNLLFNGNLELGKPVSFYYDNAGDDSGTAYDVPGWEAFAVGDTSSWVAIATDTNTFNTDLNLNGTSYSVDDPFLGLAGIQTAAGNRVAVTPGALYYATVTCDSYYSDAGLSYFIDWFDDTGALVSSSGGLLGDPNGSGSFAPFTQRLAVGGIAPDNAIQAGVRFQSVDGAPDYATGATADNFELFAAQTQPIPLVNGDLEAGKPVSFYYDNAGDDSGTAYDVPGWEAFAVGDTSSWVGIATDTNTFNTDLNLNGTSYSVAAPFLGLAGIQTAVGNRVTVTPGTIYFATVTCDSYYSDAGLSYFIDWFDDTSALISSSGGLLGDPNGSGVFAPFAQRLAVGGIAPDNATQAGVRFQSVDGAPDYATGATADNFAFAMLQPLTVQPPVLAITNSGTSVIVSWSNGPGFILQQTGTLSGTPAWADLGAQNPQTIAIGSANVFFRLRSP